MKITGKDSDTLDTQITYSELGTMVYGCDGLHMYSANGVEIYNILR